MKQYRVTCTEKIRGNGNDSLQFGLRNYVLQCVSMRAAVIVSLMTGIFVFNDSFVMVIISNLPYRAPRACLSQRRGRNKKKFNQIYFRARPFDVSARVSAVSTIIGLP